MLHQVCDVGRAERVCPGVRRITVPGRAAVKTFSCTTGAVVIAAARPRNVKSSRGNLIAA